MAVTAQQAPIAAASLRTELWASLATASSCPQIASTWAGLLQHAFESKLVSIWTVEPDGDLLLQSGLDANAAAEDSPNGLIALEDAAEQTSVLQIPLMISSAGGRPVPAQGLIARREQVGPAILLQPLISQGRVLGIVAVSFVGTCTELEARRLQTAGDEMGSILSRLRRDEKLRDAMTISDALLEWAPIGVACLDSEGNLRTWNAAAEQIFGWRAPEVVGRGLPMIGCSERELFETCIRGALTGHSTRRLETRVRSKHRGPIEAVLSMAPVYDTSGAVTKIMIYLQDVGDRKRAERRLYLQYLVTRLLNDSQSIDQAIHALLALLCAHLGLSCAEFWSVEKKSKGKVFKRTTSWHSSSPAAVQFEHSSRNWKPGAPDELAKRILREGRPIHLPAITADRALDRGPLAVQCGFEDAIGFPVAVGAESVGVVLLFTENSVPPDEQLFVCLSVIAEQVGQLIKRLQVQDVLRATEEKLLQAQKMDAMGRLVGGVVHDFNNLLTVILGYSELLLDPTTNSFPQQDAIVEVRNAARQSANLTKRLLSFYRKKPSNPVVLNLNASIAEIEPMIRRLIGKEIELCIALTSDLQHIHADPTQIEQVLMNLVVNARDAIPDRGRLTIETRNAVLERGDFSGVGNALPGSYVVLTVRDTGTGMEQATQQCIFEPFYTTKPSGKGTGLGLSTVRDVLAQCGGDITVESQPGAGTTFRLAFPTVAKGLSAWEVHLAPEAVPTGNETILVVDDDPSVRRLVKLILQARRYTVLEAGDAATAIQLCKSRSNKINLLITDMVMPDMNGVALAGLVRKLRPDIKVLVTSAYGAGEFAAATTEEPAWPHLEKPFTSHDLAAMVRRTLDAESVLQS